MSQRSNAAMRTKVIFAVAVVLIAILVVLISREDEGVPLEMVSGFSVTNSLLQVVFTNHSQEAVMV